MNRIALAVLLFASFAGIARADGSGPVDFNFTFNNCQWVGCGPVPLTASGQMTATLISTQEEGLGANSQHLFSLFQVDSITGLFDGAQISTPGQGNLGYIWEDDVEGTYDPGNLSFDAAGVPIIVGGYVPDFLLQQQVYVAYPESSELISWDITDPAPAQTPEPSSLLLLAAGLMGLMWTRRFSG